MSPEDEAFEELSRRQGDWGLQGSRKHQIIRYAETNARNEEITHEIIEMARQAGLFTHKEVQPEIVAFAKLIADKAFQNGYEKGVAAFNDAVLLEREACAKVAERFEPDEKTSYVTYASTAIRARGEQA